MQQVDKQQQELLKEYEALIDMFSTDGWQIWARDQKEALQSLVENAPRECPTDELWQFRRGEIQKLEQIVAFEEFTKQSYDLLLAPPEEEDWAYE